MKPAYSAIRSTAYDPARHQLPTAYGRVEKGSIVAAAVGADTFTVSKADASVGYADGIALNDAEHGEDVQVAIKGRINSTVPNAPYHLMVMEREPSSPFNEHGEDDVRPLWYNVRRPMNGELPDAD